MGGLTCAPILLRLRGQFAMQLTKVHTTACFARFINKTVSIVYVYRTLYYEY